MQRQKQAQLYNGIDIPNPRNLETHFCLLKQKSEDAMECRNFNICMYVEPTRVNRII